MISVGMLSEGWDAKTVTHVMGLRAFSSQLLCEQVVGRGLRRTAYEINPDTGLFDPEYVNVFGVPFSFLPHESRDDTIPLPPAPKTAVHPVPEKAEFELSWPNVVRIEQEVRPRLTLDFAKVQTLELDASDTAQIAELAPTVDGQPDVTNVEKISLQKLAAERRIQRIVFEAAGDVYDKMAPDWKGNREFLLAQLVRLIERIIPSGKICVTPAVFAADPHRRRLVIALNMTRVVQHIWQAIRFQNANKLTLVLDRHHPIRSTADMRLWYTGKPCEYTKRSHINYSVYDSTWETAEAGVLDCHPAVKAWVKNDHLGFEIFYVYKGTVRKYRPDFLARLSSGDMLVLEVKGQENDRARTKHNFLGEWVKAVNADGRFGRWRWDVSRQPGDIRDILDKAVAQVP